MLVVRMLWSFVWYPAQPVAAAEAPEDDGSEAGTAVVRRRRMRRET